MHIIVLGGAGAMGRVTVRALSEYDDVAAGDCRGLQRSTGARACC